MFTNINNYVKMNDRLLPVSTITKTSAKVIGFIIALLFSVFAAYSFISSGKDDFYVGLILLSVLLFCFYFSTFLLCNVYAKDNYTLVIEQVTKDNIEKKVVDIYSVEFYVFYYKIVFKNKDSYNFSISSKVHWIQATLGYDLKEAFIEHVRRITTQ